MLPAAPAAGTQREPRAGDPRFHRSLEFLESRDNTVGEIAGLVGELSEKLKAVNRELRHAG